MTDINYTHKSRNDTLNPEFASYNKTIAFLTNTETDIDYAQKSRNFRFSAVVYQQKTQFFVT